MELNYTRRQSKTNPILDESTCGHPYDVTQTWGSGSGFWIWIPSACVAMPTHHAHAVSLAPRVDGGPANNNNHWAIDYAGSSRHGGEQMTQSERAGTQM